jgi:uncharacterized protein YneR
VQLDRADQSVTAPRTAPQPFNGPAGLKPHQDTRPDAYVNCGHNSSGWTSQTETPPTIRVYMTGTGDVVVYNFQFYEQHVLPNEWGTGAPYAALQAGAEAVRDYAWYFVLNGSKGTAADVNPCSFDVDDTTAYQDFVPSGPTSTNTNTAVTSTASTVFSHGGTITETSFCSNFVTDCGADSPPDSCGELATGTSMSQIGSDSCADDGDSWEKILSIYYYPGYELTNDQVQMAFQANTGDLWYYTPANAGNRDTGLGMANDTSPSIAASGEVAFQGTNNHLWLYDPSTGDNRDTGLGMAPKTSPSIVSLAHGGYEIAFQANTGILWLNDPSTGTSINTGLGMDAATSPAITATSSSYEVAFQANSADLWYYTPSNAGNRDTGLGMDAATSPAITATSSSYEVAFQANSADLWYYTPSNAGNRNTGLGMEPGTSPAITATSSGSPEIAFQANNNHLWYYTPSNAGKRDTGLGMDTATSPAITNTSGGGYEIAFQANNNHLWLYTPSNAGDRDTGLGMDTASSPALPSP